MCFQAPGGWLGTRAAHSIAEQRVFTDGRIVVSVIGNKAHREEKKRADYVFALHARLPHCSRRGQGPLQDSRAPDCSRLKTTLRFSGCASPMRPMAGASSSSTLRQARSASFVHSPPTELWQRLADAEDITSEQRDKF